LHVIAHMALVIFSHVHRSRMMPVLALISSCMLIAVLVRAKNLSDTVTSSVQVLRKFSTRLGGHVSIASGEGTLLQLEFLHNKLRILVDLHESHQLGAPPPRPAARASTKPASPRRLTRARARRVQLHVSAARDRGA
jgi:hypothetical protein